MRIGCGATYTNTMYASFRNGAVTRLPSGEDIVSSIQWASENGFRGIEVEILSSQHIKDAFVGKNLHAIASSCKEYGLKISDLSVPFISQVFPDNVSSQIIREEFKECVRIAKSLDSDTVVTHSPPYPDTILDPSTLYPTGPPIRMTFQRRREWEKAWESLVAWIGELCDIAKSEKLRLAIEPRPRETISNTDSILMLLKEVKSTNLGVLFDTSHHFVMKEVLPISIWKLGKSIFCVHLNDNDGIIEHYWAPGEGKIEWIPVLQAFLDEGYDGFMMIEASGFNKSIQDFLDAKTRVENWLSSILKEGSATQLVR